MWTIRSWRTPSPSQELCTIITKAAYTRLHLNAAIQMLTMNIQNVGFFWMLLGTTATEKKVDPHSEYSGGFREVRGGRIKVPVNTSCAPFLTRYPPPPALRAVGWAPPLIFSLQSWRFWRASSDLPNAAAGWGNWCDFLKFRLNPVFGPGFGQLNMGWLG